MSASWPRSGIGCGSFRDICHYLDDPAFHNQRPAEMSDRDAMEVGRRTGVELLS